MTFFVNILSQLNALIISVISFLFSVIFYFIGIGLTSLFARLAGKKFLNRHHYQSSWIALRNLTNLEKPY